ncbi:MAG: hypothetical protein ACYDCK_11830 [Thermoplasmatota archaeon]
MARALRRAEDVARRPPRRATVFTAILLGLALASLATGILDVALPVLQGEPPFSSLFATVSYLGYPYLFLHIFVHNFGLACLVPGVGLAGASLERTQQRRVLIAIILLGAVILGLLAAVEYILESGRFDLPVALALLALESLGVLTLAFAGYRVVRDHKPTPRIGWSLVHPSLELAPYFLASGALLAATAYAETLYIAGH